MASRRNDLSFARTEAFSDVRLASQAAGRSSTKQPSRLEPCPSRWSANWQAEAWSRQLWGAMVDAQTAQTGALPITEVASTWLPMMPRTLASP